MNLSDKNPIKGPLIGLGASFVFGFCWIVVACSSGCANLPADPATRAAAVSNTVDTATLLLDAAWEHWKKHHDPATAEAGADTPAPAEDSAASVAGSPLVWRFGGFDGSRAAEDPATQIRDFRMDGRGMSYAWAKGDLGNWGLARTASGALICAFYFDERELRWIGGKFDWISSSRTTRDFVNIRGGYNGWSLSGVPNPCKVAFVIIDEGHRRRSNVIAGTWSR